MFLSFYFFGLYDFFVPIFALDFTFVPFLDITVKFCFSLFSKKLLEFKESVSLAFVSNVLDLLGPVKGKVLRNFLL